MYFVNRGVVEVVSADRSYTLAQIYEGEYFCEVSFPLAFVLKYVVRVRTVSK